jgi:hypothetical protein
MANTPFKLKSGNVTPFKIMGSSPMKKGKSGMSNEGYAAHIGQKYTGFTKPHGLNTSKNNNEGTLKGITKFESDFPKLSKLTKLHNEYVTKPVIKSYKKVYDYFTKT